MGFLNHSMMATWLQMGARNLLKNRRRSLFTIGAVAIGYCAVAIFTGFIVYIFVFLQEGFVHAYANGHVMVFQQGPSRLNAYAPAESLLDQDTVERVRTICLSDERVLVATPQLCIRGLVSNGQYSTVFAGVGRVPQDVQAIQESATTHLRNLTLYEGRPLEEGRPGIGVSAGLASLLGVGLQDSVLLLATTWEGHMNAVDAEMWQSMDAPSDILQDLLLDLPLDLAQSLYGTDGADRIVVLLRDGRETEAFQRDLREALQRAGLKLEVREWTELFPSHDRLQQMFAALFAFIYGIVVVIVALSVINTVSMSVLERTREIGVLRSLGLRRRGVLILFAVESGLLGLAGALLGVLLTQGIWAGMEGYGVQWHPPVVMCTVPLELHLKPAHLLANMLMMTGLAVGAALWPARRASHMNVVDALGHV